MRKVISGWTFVLMLGGVFLASATGVHAQASKVGAERKPGLSVCYIYALVRHIDEIADWESSRKCNPGPPLEWLNSRVGRDLVLTSKSDNGVIAKIRGFIHLEKVGSYGFTFESNDGVRLTIDGKMIVEDPGVHSDQFSEIGAMEVRKPGWYPLAIDYFERKNTSTLRFFWKPPGVEGTFPLVPAKALAH